MKFYSADYASRSLNTRDCRLLSFITTLSLIYASTLLSAEVSSVKNRRAVINPTTVMGIAVGEQIPVFGAKDQNGNFQDFSSIRGLKGAVIYFHRSAAWCIYCRAQLVQMEESKEALQRNGFGIAAISYDSPEVLRKFAKEKKISFPLLSDSGSKIIRDFNILDSNVLPGSPAYGVPYHGSYLVNEAGVVVAKLFDVESTLGHSTGVVVTRFFGSPLNTHEKVVRHDHLSLKYYASSNFASAGDRIELTIDVILNEKIHVYAPGGANNLPIGWELQSRSGYNPEPVNFPAPETGITPSTHEKTLVYSGRFQLSRTIAIGLDNRETLKSVDSQGNLLIKGAFSFQACNERICFLPRSIPLEWKLGTVMSITQANSNDQSQ
jgi:peroxiredoxin